MWKLQYYYVRLLVRLSYFPKRKLHFYAPITCLFHILDFFVCNRVEDYLRLFFSVQPFLMFYQRIVRLKSKKKTLYQGKIHHILCPEIPNPEKFLNRYWRTEGERYCYENFFTLTIDMQLLFRCNRITDWFPHSFPPSLPSQTVKLAEWFAPRVVAYCKEWLQIPRVVANQEWLL